jgi:hypothetical protein
LKIRQQPEKAYMDDNTSLNKKKTPHMSPKIIADDEHSGLILAGDIMEHNLRRTQKSYNKSTKRPKRFLSSEDPTVSYIKALGGAPSDEQGDALVIDSKTNIESLKLPFPEGLKYAFPKWRDTPHQVRAIYVQKALAKRATENKTNQYAITIRLSPMLGRLILDNGGAKYLLSRLALELKRTIGYSPDMWIQLEGVNRKKNGVTNLIKGSLSLTQGVLHAHGGIALKEKEIDGWKRVVRKLNKATTPTLRNKELRSKPIYHGFGWVGYCNKNPSLNKVLLKDTTPYSRTQALGSLAQELYDVDRKQFQQFMKAGLKLAKKAKP